MLVEHSVQEILKKTSNLIFARMFCDEVIILHNYQQLPLEVKRWRKEH
jgi:hypothetical protein